MITTTETTRPIQYDLGDVFEWCRKRQFNMTIDDLAERLRPVANASYASIEDQEAAMRSTATRLMDEWTAGTRSVIEGTACSCCFASFDPGDVRVPDDFHGHPAFMCAHHPI